MSESWFLIYHLMMEKKYSGQIFGVRAKEVFLFQQSRPVFNFIRKEDDIYGDLKRGFEENFDENLSSLETDLEAFSNEPMI